MNITSWVDKNIVTPATDYIKSHSYLNFNQNVDTVYDDSIDLGFCTPNENKQQSILMDYFGTDLYDMKTGKYAVNMLYADLTWKQHTIFNERIKEYNITRGLLCKKIDTKNVHFKYDVHFFTKFLKSNSSINIIQNMDISTATRDYILQNRDEHTSLEFFGYFKSPTAGIYNIKITTGNNDAALLWIGDDALVNYSMTNIISDNKSTSLAVKVVKDKYYPIRIQYGTHDMSKSPNLLIEISSDATNVFGPIDDYLFSINKANIPYEPIQLCFSFIKSNDSDSLFRLMVSKYDVNNNAEYNTLIRKSLSEPKVIFIDIPLFPAGLISFQNTGNLILTSTAGNTIDLTQVPNYMSCQDGTNIENAPDIQLNNDTITTNLTTNKTKEIDVNTGLPYTQFTYSSSGSNPSNPSDIYSANYVLGNKSKTSTYSSVPDINVNNLNKVSQCSFTLTFTNDGDIQINNEKRIIWTLFKGITPSRGNPKKSSPFSQVATKIKKAMTSSKTVMVRDWYEEYYNSYMNFNNNQNGLGGSMMRNTMKGGSNFTNDLIASNGKCKIMIDANTGNYVFRYAIHVPTKRKFITTSEYNSGLVYLFLARMDMKVGKTFLVNSTDNSMQYIPTTIQDSKDGSNILNYSSSYTKYDGKYPYPPNVLETGSNYLHWQNLETPCDIMCNKTNGCTHYYSYKTTDGSTHCTINNDELSARYLPEKHKDNISSTNLYIRDKMIKSECNVNKFIPYDPKINSVINGIEPQSTTLNAYDTYAIKYSSYPITTTTEGPCSDPTINSNINSYLASGTTQKEGFGTRSGTTTGGWREAFTIACDSNNPNVEACRTELINKVTSLQNNEAKVFNKTQSKIDENYQKLNRNINYYKTLNPKVNGPYEAIDNQGHLNYIYNDKPSIHLEDTRLEDSKQQLLAENNMYIIGTIITATLIIGVITISNR